MHSQEVKQLIRQLHFPRCSQEALIKIASLVCGRVPSKKSMDLATDLMAEFVFAEIDGRGAKRTESGSSLNMLDQLRLITVIIDFFLHDANSSMIEGNPVVQIAGNEAATNTMFLSLFVVASLHHRMGLLSRLVSLALSSECAPLLRATSVWMQQLGNTSPSSCQLTTALVNDFFQLLPDASTYERWPIVAPQFTANFMTAVAECYFNDSNPIAPDGYRKLALPPDNLLECFTGWVSADHRLCMSAQLTPSALPMGAIAMEATTPFAGLVRWCVLAPLYRSPEDERYAKLHLAVLNSVMEVPQSIAPRALNASHLIATIAHVHMYIASKYDKPRPGATLVVNDPALDTSLDRLAQSVQVALAARCVYGNIDDLMNQLKRIPVANVLLNIVIEMDKQNKL